MTDADRQRLRDYPALRIQAAQPLADDPATVELRTLLAERDRLAERVAALEAASSDVLNSRPTERWAALLAERSGM